MGWVRTDSDLGHILWYRHNNLHSALMKDDEAPQFDGPAKKGDIVNARLMLYVDWVEMRGGTKISHAVAEPWGSKAQRGGHIPALNPNWSTLPLRSAENVVEWGGLGCASCGSHMVSLPDLRTLAEAASRAAGPHKLVV